MTPAEEIRAKVELIDFTQGHHAASRFVDYVAMCRYVPDSPNNDPNPFFENGRDLRVSLGWEQGWIEEVHKVVPIEFGAEWVEIATGKTAKILAPRGFLASGPVVCIDRTLKEYTDEKDFRERFSFSSHQKDAPILLGETWTSIGYGFRYRVCAETEKYVMCEPIDIHMPSCYNPFRCPMWRSQFLAQFEKSA